MSEIRYREIYEQGTGLITGYEPYEVSVEELEHERDLVALDQLLSQSPPAGGIPEIWAAVKIMARLLNLR